MMDIKIKPSVLAGNIAIPASKSAMQRACALALLHNGKTVLKNKGISNDDVAAKNIITQLGAKIEVLENGILEIYSNGILPKKNIINCGESGLSLRMFAPIIALHEQQIQVVGNGSLPSRPTPELENIFKQLNVSFQHQKHCVPFEIKGPLIPKNILLHGSQSSQYLTGILIAFAYAATEKITITVTNLTSKPYIDLTLHILTQFGYNNIKNNDYKEFIIYPKEIKNKEIEYNVEADWSSASFWLAAASYFAGITISNLNTKSTQADKQMLVALENANIKINKNSNGLNFTNQELINGFYFDATECPDLFPALVTMAMNAKEKSRILGINRLTHKESNRALALKDVFEKTGAVIELENNEMIITPSNNDNEETITLSGYHDHRIVMSLAIAASMRKGNTIITGAEAINKSYPQFFEHFKLCNGNFEII